MEEAGSFEQLNFKTVAEVATALRVSRMTVYRMVKSGTMESIRVGRGFRIPERAVNDYLRDAAVAAWPVSGAVAADPAK